jgi:DNA-binding MarR family transcriptional regulator
MHLRSADPAVASAMASLRRLVRALRASAHSAERGLGISGAQLFVLGELAAEPGASLSRLAERTSTDPSSVSVVVARLVARGLVARRRHPSDARRASLSLSAKGQALLRKAPEPVQARLVDALRAVPRKDLRRVADTLATVVDGLGLGGGAAAMFFEDEPRRRARRGS